VVAHPETVVMTVSIIVPAFNEAKLIEAVLDSIRIACRAFDQRGWRREIVVCDNNSSDGTGDLARAAGACVVFEPVNQISRARNRGGRAATGDWLIFVDADSFPSEGLFEDVARAIEGGVYLGGGALVRLDGARGLVRCMNGVWNWISRMTGWAAGSFMFCESGAFRELGGLSEDLFASEEIEFSRRLKSLARRQGRRTVILRKHPLLTSARKAQLCSPLEYVRLLIQTVWHRGTNLRQRDGCWLWYDGRR
jgi:glycosyltransferase involved in cell wall biosynthesis